MYHYYWNDWGWNLWFGVVFLLISSNGNLGYSYQTQQKYNTGPRKKTINILDE